MECIILASGSPRRREILTDMGVAFEICAADVDEACNLGARAAVAELSRRKALAVSAAKPGRIVLAADTLVAVDDVPMGKPRDTEDALAMLRKLSGRWHQVHTGVCVVDTAGGLHAGVDTTDVRFDVVSDEELRAYIATGEPMDKAGAYAIQGAAGQWIPEIRGSRTGVIGLPVDLTRRLLAACGVDAAGTKKEESLK